LDSREQAEYAAMRDTIRQRGTARMALVPATFIGWAGAAIGTAAVLTTAISTLIPLMILAAGFEAIFALHVNVERIGRYLQVFHEQQGGWEQVAMRFGARFPGTAPDPLFAQLFVLGTSVNFLPAALWAEEPLEIGIIAALHLVLIYRIRTAKTSAARERAADLQRFEQLRNDSDLPQM
jgi:hypothetical protein